MEVTITKLNHSGEGIGYIDGKIVFIPKTIPGDIVEIKIIKEHKNYIEAIPTKYIEYSKDRVEIKCPYYKECGGCQLMGLPYPKQLEYKCNKAKNILNKYASLNLEPTITESNIYNYRNKITLQVENGNIGLYTSNSHDLIQIDKCHLISNNMNNIIPLIKELDLSNISQIIIREATNQLMIKFIGKINISTLTNKLSSKVDSIYLNKELIYGTPTITENLG